MDSTDQLLLLNRICDLYEDELQSGRTPEPNDFAETRLATDSAISTNRLASAKENTIDEIKQAIVEELEQLIQVYQSNRPLKASKQFKQSRRSTRDVGIQPTRRIGARTPEASTQQSKFELPSIPDYSIGELIGSGGMGVVYRATHLPTQRQIAIKFVNPRRLDRISETNAGMTRDRFQQETRAAARIDHPGIVTVFDVRLDHDPPFYTMQLIDGPSLASMLADGPLVPEEAARLVCQCALAIHAANEQGVVHRDIKPQNILMSKSEQSAFIADFGLAKLATDNVLETMDGELLGTPAYMSPEQSRSSKHVTVQSDVYSLGATLYHAIAGRPPFQAATYAETIRLIHHSIPLSPRELNPSISTDLESICLKCLEHGPEGRYATAGELANDLDRFLNNLPTIARPISALQKTRKWFHRNRDLGRSLVAIGVLLASILVTLVIAVWIVRGQNTKLNSLLISEQLAKQDVEKSLQDSYQALEPYLRSVYSSQGLLHDIPGYQGYRQEMLIQSVEVLEALCQIKSADPQVKQNLVYAYHRLGKLEMLLGNPQGAVDAFNQVEKHLGELRTNTQEVVLGRGSSFNVNDRRLIGEVFRDKAVALCDLGDVESARNEFQRAVVTLRSVADESREVLGGEHAHRLLTYANALRMYGKYCLDDNQLDDAAENLQAAVDEFYSMIEYGEHSVYHQKDLALTYAFLADMFTQMNEPELACKKLSQLEELLDEIQPEIDNNYYGVTEVRFTYARCHVMLAELKNAQPDFEPDQRDRLELNEATLILETLSTENKLVPSYRDWFQRAQLLQRTLTDAF